MKKYIKNILLVLFVLFPLSVFPQNKELNLQVFAGYSIPTSNFGLKIDHPINITRRAGFFYGEDVGLASNGYVIGAELTIPVLLEGLGWQISAKYMINPTDKSSIENEFRLDPKVNGYLEFETGNWINIPIFSGLSYGINAIGEMNIYLHLQAGLNITKQAFRKATLDGTIVEDTEFKRLVDFGFETGISFDYSEMYCLSFRYINLSVPRYEGKRTLNELLFTDIVQRENAIDAEEKSVILYYITLGIKI